MGSRNPTYSPWLQPCSFTYETVGTVSIFVLKPCELFLESKNFHSKPDRIFFHMTFLLFLTCSVPLIVCFRLITSLHLQNKLFPWTTEGSSEVDDIVSTSSTSAWAGFTHYGSVEGFFSKKTCFFEFELKLWQLLSQSHPLWAFAFPYIFAFLLWKQLVDFSGLLLGLKVGLDIFLLSVI